MQRTRDSEKLHCETKKPIIVTVCVIASDSFDSETEIKITNAESTK